MRSLPLLLALVPSIASAVEFVPLWGYARWPAPSAGQDVAPVAGTDGWIGGYERDPWTSTRTGEFLLPTTDDNEGFGGGGFGDGGPSDNWLIRGPTFRDGGIRVDVGNSDDDAVGIVLSHDGDATFYLAFHTSDATPPGLDRANDPTLILLRVEGGQVTRLGRTSQGVDALGDTTTLMRFDRADDHLTVTFGSKVLLDVVDPAPLPPGMAGVWSYDCGADGDTCFFDLVNAFLFDTDGDGTPDDAETGDTDAGDTDAGGDTDVTGGDTDVTGGDTDVGVEDTDGPDIGHSLDEDLTAGCEGCAGVPSGAATGGWVVLGLAALARRRARARAACEDGGKEAPRC